MAGQTRSSWGRQRNRASAIKEENKKEVLKQKRHVHQITLSIALPVCAPTSMKAKLNVLISAVHLFSTIFFSMITLYQIQRHVTVTVHLLPPTPVGRTTHLAPRATREREKKNTGKFLPNHCDPTQQFQPFSWSSRSPPGALHFFFLWQKIPVKLFFDTTKYYIPRSICICSWSLNTHTHAHKSKRIGTHAPSEESTGSTRKKH